MNKALVRFSTSSIAISVYGMILVIADMAHWTYTNMHAARICGKKLNTKYRPPYIPPNQSNKPLWCVEYIAQNMRAAIIRRHKHDSVIIEARRKIMGVNVRSGYRGVSTGGSTGIKISESEAFLRWKIGRASCRERVFLSV